MLEEFPDIRDIGLMEDRVPLRISSQHLANWLQQGVITAVCVEVALRRMATKIDQQNAGEPGYREMSDAPEVSWAFQAARALLFEGTTQPNGYIVPLLYHFRREAREVSPMFRSEARLTIADSPAAAARCLPTWRITCRI